MDDPSKETRGNDNIEPLKNRSNDRKQCL
jgi:hypothetical protein